jgi:hypothetical protein
VNQLLKKLAIEFLGRLPKATTEHIVRENKSPRGSRENRDSLEHRIQYRLTAKNEMFGQVEHRRDALVDGLSNMRSV